MSKSKFLNLSLAEEHDSLMTHLMLHDSECAMRVSETKEWKENRILEAKVTINGIDYDFNLFEEWLMVQYEHAVNEAKKQYADVDAEVQRRVDERLKKEAYPVLSKLYKMTEVLEDFNSTVKPYWEKPEITHMELAEIKEVLDVTRKLVGEAALTGFVPSSGDWVEKLFANNARLTEKVNNIEEVLNHEIS